MSADNRVFALPGSLLSSSVENTLAANRAQEKQLLTEALLLLPFQDLRERKERNPQAVHFLVTSWSCRSSSRWRTSFSAAATTFLRFCRKFFSSMHRSKPRRASRFLGLKHKPWVLRPGHKYYMLLLVVIIPVVFTDWYMNSNVINEKVQHHRQASANCLSFY